MQIKRVVLLGAMLGVVSAVPVQAADGFYLGAGVGESTVREDTSSGSFDSTATGYKAFGGYRFNKIPIIDLAAEAGYIDFGKPSQTLGTQNAEFKLHGGYLAGLLIFPLGPLDFYGKGGALSWKLESSVGGTTNSRSGTDAFYGAGVGFYLWKIGIRAEYERFQIKEVDRVQMLSVSALFQF
jgi:OOP family OmpA-OmpF porin